MDARDSSQSQVKSSQSQSDAESESRVNEFVTVIAPDTDFGCECECERRSIRSAAAEAEAIAAAIAPGALLCLLCAALPSDKTTTTCAGEVGGQVTQTAARLVPRRRRPSRRNTAHLHTQYSNV